MTSRVGVIGYPIRHSISPVFQQAALDHCSLDAVFTAWEVEPGELTAFMAGVRSPDMWGINVTVPHKEAVMRHLDRIDGWAEMADVVNVVVNEGGRLSGYNTDGVGFLRALEEHGRFSPEGRRVLILGAGGSAKAVALALAGRGVAAMTIANRSLDRALALARLLEGHCPSVGAVPLLDPGEAAVEAAMGSDLLVNCTTLGMRHGPGEGRSPLPAGCIPPHALVYDLVYNPPETPLIREAATAGALALGGLPMLVYQGAAAFQLWTGREAPVEVMMRAAKAALD